MQDDGDVYLRDSQYLRDLAASVIFLVAEIENPDLLGFHLRHRRAYKLDLVITVRVRLGHLVEVARDLAEEALELSSAAEVRALYARAEARSPAS